MFEMRDVGFEPFEPLQGFIVHIRNGSQIFPIRQTTSTFARLKRGGQSQGRFRDGNRLQRHRLVVI
jgi:hypothetical protein